MRLMLVSGLLSIVLSSLADAARQPIGTLFQYSVAENDAGSCKKYGDDRLNRILDDVYTLATQNSQAMVDYGDDDADKQDAAKRLVNVMFQRPSEDERQIVTSMSNRISELVLRCSIELISPSTS